MKILAIETSCDETAIAIVEAKGGVKIPSFHILSNIVASQVKLHAKFGGVVPNLAKREHQRNLVPVLLQALEVAGLTNNTLPASQAKRGEHITSLHSILERESELFTHSEKHILNLKPPAIDAIAVTVGPGLAPALWVGVNFAKALAFLWRKPIIPVNHMEGHIASVLLREERRNLKHEIRNPKQIKKLENQNFKFPAMALLVSGGHTELVFMKNWGDKKIIGETLDDAAGEAFDKVARLLGLPYPGGPEIAKEARKNFQFPISNFQTNSKTQISNYQIKLPRPMLHTKDYNFSFSGLKTAVRYLVENLKQQNISVKKMRPAIAKEFQDAVVDVLVAKTIRAAKEYNVKTIILGGGVAANSLLRKRLGDEIKNNMPATCYMLPDTSFTGDNAAMIAAAAYLFGKKKSEKRVIVDARLH